MKAPKRRGKARYIFSCPTIFYPYKNVIACANVCLTTNFFRLTTSLNLSLGQENIKKGPLAGLSISFVEEGLRNLI